MDVSEFRRLLEAVHLEREAELRREFDRSLPFSDGLFDRWERAERLGFGGGASIYDSAVVLGAVSVGDDTWIGPFTVLDGSGGGLTIGSNCSISAGVHVYTHDTVLWAVSGGAVPRRTAPVSIGDRCYIGSQTIVGAGVSIGPGAVVTANSFVNRDIEASEIVGGSPVRHLGAVVGDGADSQLVFD